MNYTEQVIVELNTLVADLEKRGNPAMHPELNSLDAVQAQQAYEALQVIAHKVHELNQFTSNA